MIDGPNMYAYVTNDPINYIDPMGTQSAKDCPLKQKLPGKDEELPKEN